jgi:hypothetical protein
MANRVPLKTPHYVGDEEDTYSMVQSAPGPYVMNGDFLQLNATSTDASATLQFNGRLMRVDGEVIPINATMRITGTGVQTAVVSPLVDGWIIGFIVFVSAGTITDGEIVASVEVVQGVGTGATRVIGLASGEITNTRTLGLGAFLALSTLTAAATPSAAVVTVADPAPGAQWTATVPVATTWEVLSVYAEMVLSLAVPTRTVYLNVAMSGRTIARAIGLTGWNTPGGGYFNWAPGLNKDIEVITGRAIIYEGLPALKLIAGATITSVVEAFDVADQWSNISLLVIPRSV